MVQSSIHHVINVIDEFLLKLKLSSSEIQMCRPFSLIWAVVLCSHHQSIVAHTVKHTIVVAKMLMHSGAIYSTGMPIDFSTHSISIACVTLAEYFCYVYFRLIENEKGDTVEKRLLFEVFAYFIWNFNAFSASNNKKKARVVLDGLR